MHRLIPIIRRSASIATVAILSLAGLFNAGSAAPRAQASLVSGLVWAPAGQSSHNSSTSKTAVSYCPLGKRITGGGGFVIADGGRSAPLTLTQLRPVRGIPGARDRYIASAAETPPGTTDSWHGYAYAICASPDSLPGYLIVSSTD